MANRGRPATGLERVKWTPRVDPVDLATFQAVRSELAAIARRRQTDADVFRAAVVALVATLPDAARKRVQRS